MILCLDVGNSHIFAGVFIDGNIILSFRYDTQQASTSDQLGVFLRNILREHNIDYRNIENIAISSVVPGLDYSLTSACLKYFSLTPFFLQAGVKTGLKIHTKNPLEVGADLIATAIASIKEFSNKNIVVIDFGTATTYSIISANKEFLGCIIQAGIKTSMIALEKNTAKLPSVRIIKPDNCIGKETINCIQSGLYHGQLGAINIIIQKISQEVFNSQKPFIIGTGGFVHLFEQENIFNIVEPKLVLHGLYLALKMN